MANIEELKDRLDRAAEIEDTLSRSIFALAVLTEGLADSGLVPVLVGGMAVAFYTLGGYTTKDIDVILATSAAAEHTLAGLGFVREGRFWLREDIDIALEAPGSTLNGDPDRVAEVTVEGMHAYVLGVEDVIVDRLNACVHWDSREDGRWARRLLGIHADALDWHYLRSRAREEGIADALAEMEADLSREQDR